MTKKDFELIAYCIFTTNTRNYIETEEKENEVRKRYAEWFAYNLKKKNPRFDTERFMKACGIEIKLYTCKRCGLEQIEGTREQTRDFVYADICVRCMQNEEQ